MCVHVFLGRAPGRPTGSEHSSAQTLPSTPSGGYGMQRRRMGAVAKALRTCTGVDSTQEGLQQSRGRALISYRVLQRLNPLCACARGKLHAHGCCAFARTGDSSVSRRTTCAISSSSVSKKGTFFHETGERMRTQSCTCAGVHTCTHTHTPHVCACPLYLPARTPKHRLAARRRHNLCTC